MADYRRTFPKRTTLLIVIHADENEERTLRNVGVARKEGADGVFLINHSIGHALLDGHFCAVRNAYPEFWTGINYLDLSPSSALVAAQRLSPSGLWLDGIGYREGAANPVETIANLRRFQQGSCHEEMLLFASVAFKHQPPIEDPARAARLVHPFCDVVTTSGPRTGVLPPLEKIRGMKAAIDDRPLAIASGVNAESVHQYLPYADCLLVATSVSDATTDDLVPEKVRALADACAANM